MDRLFQHSLASQNRRLHFCLLPQRCIMSVTFSNSNTSTTTTPTSLCARNAYYYHPLQHLLSPTHHVTEKFYPRCTFTTATTTTTPSLGHFGTPQTPSRLLQPVPNNRLLPSIPVHEGRPFGHTPYLSHLISSYFSIQRTLVLTHNLLLHTISRLPTHSRSSYDCDYGVSEVEERSVEGERESGKRHFRAVIFVLCIV